MQIWSFWKQWGYPVLFGLGWIGLLVVVQEWYSTSFQTPIHFEITEFEFYQGDTTQWRSEVPPDSGWVAKHPVPPGYYWWQVEVDLDSHMLDYRPLGVNILSFLGAYEIYWDGQHIGKNGHPGLSVDTEDPGGIDRVFLLPDSLIWPGKHTLTARASQFHETDHFRLPYILIGNYDSQSQSLIILAAFMHILGGVYLIIAIYYFLLFFNSFRQAFFLIFGLICIILFLLLVVEYVKFYYHYPYTFHYPRLIAISVLISAISLLIPWFFMVQFDIRNKLPILGFLVGLYTLQWVLISDYDVRTFWLVNTGSTASLLIIFWAILRHQTQDRIALMSVLLLCVTALFYPPFFYDFALFISFGGFIMLNLFVIARLTGEQRKRYEQTLLRASRLRIELLKKNIQPHYLMNTLTSLISWVEESPGVAVQFIEALAEEFDLMRQISEETQIPVWQEIILCRKHLKVMSFRQEMDFKLATSHIPEEETIPPAVFLTLIENGLSHNHFEVGEVCFQLNFHREQHVTHYHLVAPGKVPDVGITPDKGTGWQYIHARMEETFGDNWKMKSAPTEKGWETKIWIY